jgi:hypothetical protein
MRADNITPAAAPPPPPCKHNLVPGHAHCRNCGERGIGAGTNGNREQGTVEAWAVRGGLLP